MFPYWLLFTLCAAGALNNRADPQRPVQGGPLLLALGALVALMIGLRYEIGGDWVAYLAIFEFMEYQKLGDAVRMSDPGYTVLNWIVYKAGFEIWMVNTLCGAIFSWGLVAFARRQPNPWLAIVVAVPYLIIVVAMGYARQGVAIGLILLGIIQLRDRHSMVRFAVFILAAATFHKTAIIVLPLVTLAAARNRFIIASTGVLLGGILYYLFVNASIDRLMQHYVEEEYDSSGAFIRLAMNLPPAMLFLLLQNRFGFSDFERKMWRNFAYAALAAFAVYFTISSSTVIDRLALYAIPLQMIIYSRLPLLFGHAPREHGALKVGVIAYSGFVLYVWLTTATHASQWLPYTVYPLWLEHTAGYSAR